MVHATFPRTMAVSAGTWPAWPAPMHWFAASAARPGGMNPFRRRTTAGEQNDGAALAAHGSTPICTFYTDGACYPNQDPGPGGWAYVGVIDGKDCEESGEDQHTTATRMQLIAAIKALEATIPTSKVIVYTHSQIVQRGMTAWIHKWLRNNWRKSSGQPVDHQALWERLHALREERSVEWILLPGSPNVADAAAHNRQTERVHSLVYEALHRVAAGSPDHPGDALRSQTTHGAAPGGPVVRNDTGASPDDRSETNADAAGAALDLRARTLDTERAVHVVQSDTQRALGDERQALERRWAQLHAEVLRLDEEWQRLLDAALGHVEGEQNGQPLDWDDGAILFANVRKHGTRVVKLADEALQVCDQYTNIIAVQRMMERMSEP